MSARSSVSFLAVLWTTVGSQPTAPCWVGSQQRVAQPERPRTDSPCGVLHVEQCCNYFHLWPIHSFSEIHGGGEGEIWNKHKEMIIHGLSPPLTHLPAFYFYPLSSSQGPCPWTVTTVSLSHSLRGLGRRCPHPALFSPLALTEFSLGRSDLIVSFPWVTNSPWLPTEIKSELLGMI